MKLCVPSAVLFAAIVGLVVTYGGRSLDLDRQNPGTGPVTEPHPITLRSCAKDVILQAIVDDDLSLPEAAALCGEVYRSIPNEPGLTYTIEFQSVPEPMTTEERLCRRVLGWAKTRVPDDTYFRLHAEYREWRRAGTGRLPDTKLLVPSTAELLERARVEWLAQCRGVRDRQPAGDFRRSE